MAFRSIDEQVIKQTDIVCLAVHETLENELEKVLLTRKIENYVWIYPFLLQLLPIELLWEKVPVSVNQIIQANEDYRFAIRYLAIDNYYKKNTFGFEIYLKATNLYCEYETAKKRMDEFCSLICNWQEAGYNVEKACYINEEYRVLDGAHRISLAKYYGQGEIICNVYRTLSDFWRWYEGEAALTKKDILSAGFSAEEVKIIEDADRKVREGTYK